MPSVYVRVRETHDHVMVSVCDKQLLGTTLTEGKITFKVSEEFYGGDIVDLKTCIKYLKNATIANLIGNVAVNAAKKAGLVHEAAVIFIEGHQHAQWVRL